jgi:phosphatidate cytidylyltransferase
VTALELLWPTLGTLGGLLGAGGLAVALAAGHAGRAGREWVLRYAGWLAVMPGWLVVAFGPTWLAAPVLAAALAWAAREMAGGLGLGRRAIALLVALSAVAVALATCAPAALGPLPMLLALALLALCIAANDPGRAQRLAWPLLAAFAYAVWPLAHVAALVAQPGGRGLVVVLVAGCGLGDVGAYVVGRGWGGRRLAPAISPNKTWSGLAGQLLGALAAVALLGFAVPGLPPSARLALAMFIGLGAALGDLVSSLLKRQLGLKDWGRLIPGHGGLLDRLNSAIVVVPLAYYGWLWWS